MGQKKLPLEANLTVVVIETMALIYPLKYVSETQIRDER